MRRWTAGLRRISREGGMRRAGEQEAAGEAGRSRGWTEHGGAGGEVGCRDEATTEAVTGSFFFLSG